MKKLFAVMLVFVWFALPIVAQDEDVNPIIGYTQYEYFQIIDVFVPADWIEIPITEIYPGLEGGEAGMAFSSPDGRLNLDVFRDSVTGVPGDENGQRALVESNLYGARNVSEDGFLNTINGRVFYFDAEVGEGADAYRQIYYVLFASEKVYQIVATLFPNADGEITDAEIAFAHGLLSHVEIADQSISGGEAQVIPLQGGGFRAVVPSDWEQRDPATESTLLSTLQPDDIAIFIVVDGGTYSNPADDFLENTVPIRYGEETDEILNTEFVELPFGTSYMGEAINTYEGSDGTTLPIYNQDYHLLVNGTEFIGVYLSVENTLAEVYREMFADIAKTVIPVSGEVVTGGVFD